MKASEMTDEQLNEEIAKAKGWTLFNEQRGKDVYQVIYSKKDSDPWNRYQNNEVEKQRYEKLDFSELDRGKCINYDVLPHWSTSWTYAGPLLEEIPFGYLQINSYLQSPFGEAISIWKITLFTENGDIEIVNPYLPRAIAESYAVMKGLAE